MSAPRKIAARPLSPHLQVYRPQMTSVLSILHRFAGVVLAVGLCVLVWFLAALAAGPSSYALFVSYAGSPLGLLILAGISAALFYHLCNGIRHLFWSSGLLFRIEDAYRAGYIVLAASALLTILFWAMLCPGK